MATVVRSEMVGNGFENLCALPLTASPNNQTNNAVNPGGKTIPTARTSLDRKVSPYQNPDGFYPLELLDACVEPKCVLYRILGGTLFEA